VSPAQVLRGRHLVAVFDNKRDVHEMQPDFAVIAAMDVGVTVTAPAAGHDYVCRVFIPNHGINEDHASGSPQATLVPYWAARLGKKSLTAHQVSPRGGELFCDLVGKRVRVGGRAVTFATTSVRLPA
jgi:predicted PhzF superfamily epimerase YddE/YHI9